MKKTNFKKALSVFLSVLMLMSCWVFVPGEHNYVSAAYVSTNVETSFTLSPEGNRGATDWTRLALTGEGSSGGTSVVLFRFTNANLKQLSNVNEIILQFYAYSCPDRLTHKSGTAVNADIYYITKNQAFVSNQGSNKNANVGDSSHSVLGSSYGGTNVQNSAKSYFGLSDATLVGSFEQPAINGNDSANRNGAANIKCDVTNVVKQKANSGEDLAFIVMLRSAYSCSSSAGWSDIYINSDTITLSGYSGTYGMPEVGLGNNLNGSITTNVSGRTITVKYPTKMYLDISEDLSDVGYSINVSCNTNNKMIVYPAVWGGQESDKNGNFENDRANYDANLDGQNTIINAFDKYGIQKTGPGYFDNESIGGDYTTCLIHNNASNELSNGANYALQGKPRATGEYRYYLVGNSSINPRLTYLQTGGTTNKNDSGYITGNVDFTIYVYDKAPLNSAIISKTLADSESVKYTDSSWNAYKTALDNAKYILKTRETTQSAVTSAINELNSKYSALALKTFTVSFNTPADVAAVTARTFKYGDALGTTLSVPGTRSGYTFVRWYVDNNGNGRYDSSEEVTDNAGKVISSLQNYPITQDWSLSSQWKPVDVNYDNLFSLADWADSSGAIASNGENIADITVDLNNDSISVTTGPSSTYVEGYTAQSNGSGYYRFKVEPSTKYILEYDYDCSNASSVIWLWYNTSGNASSNGVQDNCAAGNGHKRVEFTTNADTSYITLRFNIFAYNTTAEFSNIAVYKADKETEITSITNREYRIHAPSKGSDLYTPVRTGYTFEGWYYDEDCTNPVGANDTFTKSTTVYSKWTINKYTITFVDASGDIVSKQTLQHGEMPTVPSLNTASGYDKDYHYDYSWPEVSSATADVTYTEVTSRTDHVYEWVIDKEATCGEAGAKYEKCKNCDTVRNENTVIPATGAHTPGAAATCTAPQTCTACGAELAAQLEHTPGAAVEENRKESTCTVAGSYDSVVYCSVCNTKISSNKVDLPLAAHVYKWVIDKEATCGAAGLKHEKCENCTATRSLDTEIPATGAHTPGAEATCTAPQTCTVCGAELAAQLDHTYEWIIDKEATCGAAGAKHEKCKNCDATRNENTVIPATGNHTLGNWIIDTDATCVTPGSQHKECANCDYETTAEAIPATGNHVYGDWAQYGEEGTTHRQYCTLDENCDEYNEEACFGEGIKYAQIADNASQHKEICKCGREKNDGHAYGSWAADPENKDNNQGKMSRICSECSYKQTSECTYTLTENVASSCTVQGHKTWVCNDCGNGYSERLPLDVNNHEKLVKDKAVAATCTDTGLTEGEHCEACDVITVEQTEIAIDADAHTTDKTHVDGYVAPTCTTPGATGDTKYDCCNAVKIASEVIPVDVSAHTGEANVVKNKADATCTSEGYTGDTYWSCCDKLETSGEEIAIDADAHTTEETYVDGYKAATCTTPGATGDTKYKCCNAVKIASEVIPVDVSAHTGEANVVKNKADATCTSEGYTGDTYWSCCDKLETSGEEIAIDADAHTTEETYVDGYKAATCTTPGATGDTKYKCCNAVKIASEVIPVDASAHTGEANVVKNKVDATCTSEGYTGDTYWSCCDKLETSGEEIAIDADAHTTEETYVDGYKAATCTTPGATGDTKHKCCNAVKVASTEIPVDATAHTGEANVVKNKANATCTSEGYTGDTYWSCCDKLETSGEEIAIDADAHTTDETYVDGYVAPTCTTPGATGDTKYKCCNAVKAASTEIPVDATAHTGEANVVKNKANATCTSEGYTGDTYWSCCDKLETSGEEIAIDADAHTTDETYVDGYVAPTCTTPGATGDTKYKCCNAVKAASTEIPALKHDYDTTKSEENLTRPVFENGAWTDGYYTYKCKNDNAHTITEEVERASYTAYEAALANLNALLATDITADAKAAINAAIEANKVAENLIASEQSSIDAKTAALEKAFEDNKGSLQTYKVTFKIDGSADVIVNVISGQDATAPANVKKDYDENNHYNFTGWDKAFTNVTSDLEVNAQFEAVAHSYTHTDKDDTYHTDKCDCGYSVDVKHTETSEVTTKASCFADGVRTYTCSVCSGTRTETIAKRTHNIVDTEVALAPTCSATGTMNQKCANEATDEYEACTYTTTRVIDIVADAHKAEADYTVMKKATCEADGYKAILCEYCDAELEKETIVKRAHDYKDNGVQTKATCLNPGVMKTICKNEETDTHAACAHESTREIAQLSHSYTGEYKWNNGADVKTHSQMCVNGCNEYGNETDCSFESVVKEPTCYANGYTTYTCTVCNNRYNANYTTREHIFVYAAGNGTEHAVTCQYDNCNYSATEACSGGTATCEAQAVCTKCNTAYGEKNADNHTNLVKTDAKTATCENAGNIAYWTCEGCKKLYSDEAATTEITNTVIPAKGHDWNEGVVTTQPTCTTPGVKTFTCENDGSHTRTENVDIDADAHSFGDWTQTKAPTCSAVGTEERVCAHNAAHKETRNVAISADAHSFGDWTQTKAPTCSAEGTEERVCAHNAAHKETRNVAISTDAHSFGDWTQTKAPTCSAVGTEERVCVYNAAHKETRNVAIDVNAHTGTASVTKNYREATCKADGYTGDIYWSCCDKLSAKGSTIPALEHVDENNDNLCDYNCGTEMNTCKHEGTPKQYITNLGENGKLNTHKIKCLACGQIVKIENCDFDTKVVAPSCYEEGYTKYTCKICTYSFVSDFVEKTEHDFGEWESNNATCHEIQSMSRRCKNTKCLYKETVKIIDENTGKYAYGAHSLVVVPGKDATCTKAGYTSYSICIHCEEVTGSKPIPAKGHADEDGNGNCDVCDSLMDSNGVCGCFCHNDSFFGKIIFKILNFFWKLFKINANCECGVKHW